MRPRLLDLFSGAGGCARGYQRAGFHVVGVDIVPQPNYCGDEFVCADALEFLSTALTFLGKQYNKRTLDFDAIHASPPCQAFTKYRNTGNVGDYPDLIAPVRELLEQTGGPYVIENVEGAPLVDPTVLCGSMFDLDVRRHRLFETNWPLEPPPWPCRHKIWGPDRFPGGRSKERTGSSRGLVRGTVEVGTWDISPDVQREAMGVDWWINLEELSEAVPPAYTKHIGDRLIAHLQAASDPSENPRYGPGNPDWERDFDRDIAL